MATNKENLERWLLIRALLKSGNVKDVEEIAETMVEELKSQSRNES